MELFIALAVLVIAVGILARLSRVQHDDREIPPRLRVRQPNENMRHPLPRARTSNEIAANHAPPPDIPASRELRGKAYVIDGDTIVVEKIKIRLAGIDAPELDRPWGQKSKWEMVRLSKGQRVKVILTGETSYDRLVGTCYLPDGRDLGAEMVSAGLALDGGYFSKGKYLHLEPAGVRKRLKPFGNRATPRS